MSQELNGTLTNSANLVGTFGNTGGGGTTNYNDLTNKPQINGVELQGNKTTSNLNISYNDLTNKPTIPAAQVNSDWNSTSGVSEILNKPSLATVATSGSYDDLTDKPTIPAAQVNSDWNSSSGVSEILNKPSLATVATSGSYDDLTDKPTIPAAQVNSDWNSVSGVSEILNKPSIPVNSDFALSGLSDTDIQSATSGQVLAYDGTKWANSNALANKLDKSALKYIVGTGITDANGILTSTAMGVAQLSYDNHIILAVQSSYNGACVNVGQYNKNFYYVCTSASGLANPIANTSVTIRIIYMDKWW